jgi:GAF domain-containing protein
VKERTSALEIASEKASRRASQFETITQVTRAITSIHKMEELMPLVATVISNYFGFYHVGIFLNDENGEKTYLIATNSEGGRKMLQRNHSLKIGEQGIVGYVAARGESRVTRNVGEDIVFFNNPDLPETKSEAGLPLRSGETIIGVLDVQSVEQDAFSQEDIKILAILADQVSLAIENTRLLETTRRSLTEAETLYRQYLHEGWSRLPQEEQLTGYRYTPRGAAPLQSPVILNKDGRRNGQGNSDQPAELSVPIKLRGETIGNLIVHAPDGRYWRKDQVELVKAVADRVALSAENARLFDETSRRAERERLVTEITSKIRSTNDPEEMINTALEELRSALGAAQIQIIPQVVPASQTSSGEASNSVHVDESGHKTQRGNGANK